MAAGRQYIRSDGIVCGWRCTKPRPMSAPWPEAQSSGIGAGNEVHTLPRASQDLVASFASSALSRHSLVSDKLKQKFCPGNTLVFLHYCLIPHHKAILRQLGQAMTTRPPWSVSSIGQGAALCHLTNGCRFKQIICLFFSFSRTTCEIHTICYIYTQTVCSLYEKGAD